MKFSVLSAEFEDPNISAFSLETASPVPLFSLVPRVSRDDRTFTLSSWGWCMRYSVSMRGKHLYSGWLVASILLSACSSQRIVPDSLEPLVDRTVSFRDVLASPESYRGRVLVLGGEVLKAKRLQGSTQIELLQLPLEDGEEPTLDRQQSQGRFLALQQEFLDPATVVVGTRVTIVGEVNGIKTDRLDDVEYRYPTLILKHLHVWPVQSYGQRRPGFSIGVFGGMGVGGGTRRGGGFGIGF